MFDANNMPILCQLVPSRFRATGYGLMNFVGISSGAYLTDHVGCCSVLVSRNVVSEERFRAAFEDRRAKRPELAKASHPAE